MQEIGLHETHNFCAAITKREAERVLKKYQHISRSIVQFGYPYLTSME